jgi:cardiolipin synthase
MQLPLLSIFEHEWAIVVSLALLAAYGLYFFSTLTIILIDIRNPTKAIAWILVITFLPLLGLLVFGVFGKNFRHTRRFSRKEKKDLQQLREITFVPRTEALPDHKELLAKSGIVKLLENNNKAQLTFNNRLQVLEDGEATFSAIFEALEQARDHIHLEYYIIEEDELGKRLRDVLVQKAREGLEVRLLYDSVGSWSLSRKYLRSLEEAGVETSEFMPVRFPRFANRINYRNHRKIVVVDGKIAFVGGLNVADRYLHGAPDIGYWRDTQLRLQGDAAKSLQSVFLTDWYFANGELLEGDSYYPAHEVSEGPLVQITSSGPDSDWASIMQAYFAAIATAEKNIYISTPYFIPNEAISVALKTAALRGVDVRLLIPQRTDYALVTLAQFSYVEEFLRAGVRVYAYKKGFNHGKLMMVDGLFASVGTANMDLRSFDQNFEVNALLYDAKATEQLEATFFQDLEESIELELKSYRSRPRSRKLKEGISRLLSPIL